MNKQLIEKARELLDNKTVNVIIGYGPGITGGSTSPVFITNPEDTDKLIWSTSCLNNLAVFLERDEIKRLGKPAIVAKGCDIKSIIGLIQENQLKREDVVIIGMECQAQGTDQPLDKCRHCQVQSPPEFDFIIKDPKLSVNKESDTGSMYDLINELEGKSHDERWEFWQGKLKNCIKCYACRQVCPLCYCNRCIVEKFQPQWIHPSSNKQGNLSWNIIRSFHLAGRCVGCGECERVCPMGIPLGLVNQKMAKEIEVEFGYSSGEEMEFKPALSDFKMEDDNTFIR